MIENTISISRYDVKRHHHHHHHHHQLDHLNHLNQTGVVMLTCWTNTTDWKKNEKEKSLRSQKKGEKSQTWNSKCNFHPADSKYICINPYHLQKSTKTEEKSHKRARPNSPATRPNVNLTDVRLNDKFQLNFDQNYFEDDRCDELDLKSPLSCPSNDSDFYEYGSSYNGSSPTHHGQVKTCVTPIQTPIYQFQHEESENWCSIKYYEYNQLVGTFDIRADQTKVQIDGFSSTNQPQRISLGAISNPFRSVKVRTCQKNIRQGQWALSGVDKIIFYYLLNPISTLRCMVIVRYVSITSTNLF